MEFTDTSAIPAIPERCFGCPMLESALMLQEGLRGEIATANTTLDENDQYALEFTENILNIASTPEDIFEEMNNDLRRIVNTAELFPDTADISLAEFLQIYRTDENKLGDQIFAPFIDIRPDVLSMSAATCIEVGRDSLQGMRQALDTQPFRQSERMISISEKLDAFTEERESIRLGIAALGEALAQSYAATNTFTRHCEDGLTTTTKGFIRKTTAQRCGATATTEMFA